VALWEATQLIFTGVFDRFPKLQIYWAENNIGWLPYSTSRWTKPTK